MLGINIKIELNAERVSYHIGQFTYAVELIDNLITSKN